AFPESVGFTSEEVALFTQNQHVQEVYKAFEALRKGKNIGSALKISLSDSAREVLIAQCYAWSNKDKQGTLDIEEIGVWYKLKSYIEVALVLSKKYIAVVANPPYMGQKSMNGELKAYLDKNYPQSKSDLFAVFMEKMMDMVQDNARMGCITMESWMFLSSYEKLRKSIIDNYSIVGLGHFGWHILGIAFGTAMLVLEKSKKIKIGEYSYLTIDDVDREINVPYVFPKKDNGRFARIPQTNFGKIPGSPIAYFLSLNVVNIFQQNPKLLDYADPKQGLATSDNNRFRRDWSEVSIKKSSLSDGNKWFPYNSGGGFRKWFGNQYYFLNWENDGIEIKNFEKSVIRSPQYYFNSSISWSKISAGGLGVRYFPEGFIFDVAGCSIFEKKKE